MEQRNTIEKSQLKIDHEVENFESIEIDIKRIISSLNEPPGNEGEKFQKLLEILLETLDEHDAIKKRIYILKLKQANLKEKEKLKQGNLKELYTYIYGENRSD